MNDSMSDYDLWSLVIINSLVFIIFAFSFARPQSSRDWRSFGAFQPSSLRCLRKCMAIVEEREMVRQFGDEYTRYAARTPRFIPRLGSAPPQSKKTA